MMDPILQTALKTIAQHNMAPPGSLILAAHSGGPDSTALLHILVRLAPILNVTVESAHFDHALREESAEDALFAGETAHRLGVAFHMERDPSPPKTQIQGNARRARYLFFQKIAGGRGLARVATGHTLDDSVETSIMWAMRGAGLSAFGGIPPVRGIFIRPLIWLRKSDPLAWLEREKIAHVTDKSNLTDKYLRNRIRRHVIPAMEQASPGAVEAVARLASLCGALGREMEEMAAKTMEEALRGKGRHGVTLDPSFARHIPFAMRGLVYKAAVKLAGGDPSAMLLRHGEAVDKITLAGALGRRLDLPGGMYAILDHGGLTFGLKTTPDGRMEPTPFICPLAAHIGGGELSVTPVERFQPGEHLVAVDRIPAGALFRCRAPGDYLVPLNFTGRKKLKKFLIEAKIPSSIRGGLPVLALGSEILWVPGEFMAPSIRAGEMDVALAEISWTP
jgi:tRNA(Ile)-lysidine synthase